VALPISVHFSGKRLRVSPFMESTGLLSGRKYPIFFRRADFVHCRDHPWPLILALARRSLHIRVPKMYYK